MRTYLGNGVGWNWKLLNSDKSKTLLRKGWKAWQTWFLARNLLLPESFLRRARRSWHAWLHNFRRLLGAVLLILFRNDRIAIVVAVEHKRPHLVDPLLFKLTRTVDRNENVIEINTKFLYSWAVKRKKARLTLHFVPLALFVRLSLQLHDQIAAAGSLGSSLFFKTFGF